MDYDIYVQVAEEAVEETGVHIRQLVYWWLAQLKVFFWLRVLLELNFGETSGRCGAFEHKLVDVAFNHVDYVVL